MKKYILNSILLCTILKIEIRLTQACADQNGVGGPNPLEISYLLNSRSIITKSIPWTSLENTIIHWTPTPRKISRSAHSRSGEGEDSLKEQPHK